MLDVTLHTPQVHPGVENDTAWHIEAPFYSLPDPVVESRHDLRLKEKMMSVASLPSPCVKVIHGANDGVFDLAGARVASIQASLVDAFNIPNQALAFVNGEQVDGEYVLQSNDTLEFCKQTGDKGGRRMLSMDDILREYTGFPPKVLEDVFANVPHHEVAVEGQPRWFELAIDEWLDRRYMRQGDDGRDKAIPPDSVRINGMVYDELTQNEWRLIDALLKAPDMSIPMDDAIELLYADDVSISSTNNRLKQAIKRLNRKSGELRRPFTVYIENGWVCLVK